MDDLQLLLVLEAHDKASGIVGKISGAFQELGEKAKAAAAKASMSTEELQAVQDRAAAAATAYSRAQTEQINKQVVLRQSTADLAIAEQEYAVKAAAAAEATRAAARATGEEAAAAREAARVQAASAQMAADIVAATSARQVEAAKEVARAEEELARRSQEAADAQRAASAETGLGATALKGVAVAGLAAAVAVGAVGVHAVKAAGDFQAGMTRLVTSAGESESAIGRVSSGVLKLSVDTATSADELSKGLYMIESAGYHGADGLNVLKAAAEGARAEGAPLEEVGNALTSMLNAYGMKAKDATKATDMMVATVAAGKMKMSDLASSLSAVLPVAAAAHISFQQVGGALATMTSQGMSAQQATQNLSHLIQKLQSPTAESVKYLAQLGLSATDLSQHLGERGLTGTLQMVYQAIAQHIGPSGQVVVSAFNKSQAAAQDLQQMLKAMPPDLAKLGKSYMDGSVSVKTMTNDIKGMSGPNAAMMKQFVGLAGNAQGFNQMLKTGNPAALTFAAALKKTLGDSTSLNTALLIGGDHMGTFKNNVNSVADAARKAGDHVNGWAEIQKTFNFKMAQLKDSVKAAEIAIGTGLLPVVSKIAQVVVSVVKPVAEWMAAHQKLSAIILGSIGALGALAAGVVGVAMAIKFVKTNADELKLALNLLGKSSPWMIALTALITIAILIATHWKQTKAIIGDVWNWIKTAAGDVAGFFVHVWKDVVKLWDDIWGAIGGTVKKWWPLILAPVTGGMSLIVGIIIKYRKQIGAAFEAVWSFLVGIWNSTGGKLIGLIEHAWSVVSGSVSKEWKKISGDLSQIWGQLIQIWNLTGGKLVTMISSHWSQIQAFTHKVWDEIWNLEIKPVWDFISSYIKAAVGFISDVISLAWATISAEAKIAWNLIWGVIKGVWDLISGAVKAACDLIYGVLIKPVFEAIKMFFEIVWDAIKGTFNTTLDAIKGILRIFIDVFTGNWSKAWRDVKSLVTTILHDVWNIIQSIFNDVARFLASVMNSIKNGIVGAWRDIWNGIKGFLSSIWNGIKSAFNAGLDALSGIWNRLKKLAADPVNFVISTVYDNGIRALWNDVSGLFGGPQAPYVNPVHFAQGGLVPGAGTGDTIPALLTPGEYVLSHDMIQQFGGPAAVESRFGAGRGDGYHYGSGGWSWNPITDIVHAAGAIGDALKNVALGGIRDAASTAFKGINGLLGSIPGAGTGFGKMLTGGIHKVEDDLLGFFGKKDQTAIPVGNVSGSLIQWLTTAIHYTGVPMSWLNGLEVIAMDESGGNPNAQNNTDSNAAAGDPSRGIMQCVALNAEILTKRGWLRHDQVQVGDETLGYNPETGRSEWTRITKVVHYRDAEVWRIGNKHWHADVTPNHRWWSDTLTRKQEVFDTCPECGWVPRGKKQPSRGVQVHRMKMHGAANPLAARTTMRGEFVRTDSFKADNRIRLAAPAATDGIPGLSLEEVRIIAWLQGDGTISPVYAKPETCPECGWLPGDYRGRVGKQPANAVAVHRAKVHGLGKSATVGELSGWDGRIWQSKPEQIVKLRALLARVDHTETVRAKRTKAHHLESHAFVLRRAFVTDLLNRSGVLETGPEAFVLALSPEQRAAWLDSMIDAEGHRQSGKEDGHREFVRIAQVDGPLQDAIKLAVFLEGYRPTFSANSAGRRGFKPAGVVGMARPHVAPVMFDKPKVLESQDVWCVKTGLETWTARQDGQIFLTGNTIMSTFQAYHQSGTSSNIFDPVANAAAAINYIRSVYGNVSNVPGIRSMSHGGPYVGYESGTWDTGPHAGLAFLHPHETVLPAGALSAGGPGMTVIFDFRGSHVMSDRDINLLTDKIGRQLATQGLPKAGVRIRM